MSKIAPMQAAALGIKTAAKKPVQNVIAAKPTIVKPAMPKTSIMPAAANTAPKTTLIKPASVKPSTTKTAAKSSPKPTPKPAAKAASQAKADHGKKIRKLTSMTTRKPSQKK